MPALTDLRRKLDRKNQETALEAAELRGRLTEATSNLTNLTQSKAVAELEVGELEQAVSVIQVIEQSWQRSFEEALSTTVTNGLSLIFNKDYEFLVKSKMRGDSSTTELKLLHSGHEMDIMDSEGGGIVVVTALLLTIVFTLSAQPPLRKTLWLDEPLAHLSPEYRPAAAALIKKLCDDAGMQVVLVTQEPEYIDAADLAYEATLDAKGHTVFTILKSAQDVCYDA